MQKRTCIIDLSTSEIRTGILTEGQFESIDPNLPWEVGFRQEADGTLARCFGDALDQLNSNRPEEVQFIELDVHLKEITDTETLECLFHAFFEEILYRRLPKHAYPVEAMSVYVITPHQWQFVHRQQLRKALKQIENNSRSTVLNPPKIRLLGMLGQVICLVAYYQKTWMKLCTSTKKLHLFLIDFTRHDLVLYQLACRQSNGYETVELCNILRYPDFHEDIEKQVSDIHNVLKTVGETARVAVGFSGAIGRSGSAIMALLQVRCNATFLKPLETATLWGGAELIQKFENSKNTEGSHAISLQFTYTFCLGVQLPDGVWVEFVPKGWTPPYHRKKAFRLTGTFKKFNIDLFCGLSLTTNSDIHQLATLEINLSQENKFSSRNPLEFILSVTLDDSTHGTFAAHLPDEQKPRSVEFTIPILMD